MKQKQTDNIEQKVQFIDITGEVCPMTFVKTKLKLEKMEHGEQLDVRLKGVEPLENVPRSVVDHGHEILSFTPESTDGPPAGVHLLRVRKLS